MQRRTAIVALAVVLWAGLPLRADEPSQVEFVRGLRARYGPRLAEDYLKRLQQQKRLDAEPRLRLELVRTQLELAAGENDLAERIRHYQEAQTEIEKLLQSRPKPDIAAEARFIGLQIVNQHGKALLNQALRQESPDAQQNQATRARTVLVEAATRLQQALDQLDAELAKQQGDAKTPQEREARKGLEDARLQAQMDVGLNYFDQALTLIDTGQRDLNLLRRRAELLGQAQSRLEKVAAADSRNSLCWQARAWTARCFQERDEIREARKRYDEIAKETAGAADAGKRLAGYFRLLMLLRALQSQTPAEPGERPELEAQRVADAWRRAYPGHLDTPEGYGVRFVLAEACLRQAETDKRIPAPRKKELLNRARTLYREVELNDGEFSNRARRRRIDVLLALQGGDAAAIEKVDVASLSTFDELYIRAQFEASRFAADAERYKENPTKLADQRGQRFGRIIQALSRGLALADKASPRVPDEDVHSARLMLAYACLTHGDLKEAIRAGEELAWDKKLPSQAATGAVYALQAYQQLLNRPATALSDAERKELQGRSQRLAEHMIQTWPDEQASDMGRHQLANLFLQERKLPEAIEQLAAIQPSYSNAILAKYQLALAALQATGQDKPTPTDKDTRPWPARGLAALAELPPLPQGADAATGRIYLLAKLKLGQLLYRDHQFAQLEALAKNLDDDLAGNKIPLDEASRKELTPVALSLRLYAAYGQLDAESTAGRQTEVVKILDPLVTRLQSDRYTEVLQKDEALRKGLLDLALRTSLRYDRPSQAIAILKVQEKYSPPGQAGASLLATLEPLVTTTIDQIQKRRVEGKRDPLAQEIHRFRALLDQVVTQFKSPSPELLRLLGQGYSSIDEHARAAELLKKVPKPVGDGDNPPDPAKLKNYQEIRALYLRELRLDQKLDQAEAELAELHKEPWAKDHDLVRIEELHLLDARGKHKEAFPGWNKLVSHLASAVGSIQGRERYFESYYSLVESYYRYGLSQDEAKRATVTKKAAGFIASLERAWTDLGGPVSEARFRKLLDAEKPLKEQYDLLKASKQ
jgi:hypothetical protein